MKKLSTLLLLFTVLFSFNGFAQLITIQGNVANLNNIPIGSTMNVSIEVNDYQGNPYYFGGVCDSLGDYSISDIYLDSLLQMVSPTMNVLIVDCNMDTIVTTFNAPFTYAQIITADFDYCPSTPNPCAITASFAVTQTNPANQNFVPNYAFIINNSMGPISTYAWDFGDGTTATGVNVSHSYPGNGPYALCLTVSDTSGCTDTFCDTLSVDASGVISKMAPGFFVQIGEGSLSTTDIENEIQLSVYPNPAKDQLNISFDTQLDGNIFMKISDITGRIIQQNILDSSDNTIDLSQFSTGSYILSIQNGNAVYTEQIIVQ